MITVPGGTATGTPPETLLRRAEELLERRDLAAARRAFDRAEAAGSNPDACCAGRWMSAMLAGHFEAAWQQSDTIRARGGADPHRFWQGEDVRGKRVIVRSLHGLGDAVQALAYAPLLTSLASRVMWEVPPRLLPLAPLFVGVGEVLTWGDAAPDTPPLWDVQVEITELPYLFRTQLQDLPMATNYLRLPAAEVRRVAEAMGARTKPRVGVVWACGEWNPSRNLPLPLLESLVRTGGIEFWNLQGSGQSEEVATWPVKNALTLCGDGLVPLAATIANLDLVLTPDTLQGHLAGALGVPSWVLLQHEADWRWMTERTDSPWYPSVRLFRQRAPGDWAGVFEQVERGLRRVLPITG